MLSIILQLLTLALIFWIIGFIMGCVAVAKEFAKHWEDDVD